MQTEEGKGTPPDVLCGLLDRRMLGQQLHVGDRTIIRYERAGMPFIAVGMLRLYDPAKVRAWLMTHERHHETPRRGRPATRKAA
jgi:hypothetical protein